jgi:hypothetical protein
MEGREKPYANKYKENMNGWNYAYITSSFGLRKL